MFKFLSCSVLVLIVATHGVVCSSVQPIQHVANAGGSLQSDFNEFLSIIPVDDIRNLTKFFYANDAQMRNSYDYLRDKGFGRVVAAMSELSLVKKFSSFLNDTGVNIAEMSKRMKKIVLTSEEAKSVAGN
jgi:Insect allergen related repeat, nitrile-specifier detoxification